MDRDRIRRDNMADEQDFIDTLRTKQAQAKTREEEASIIMRIHAAERRLVDMDDDRNHYE